MTTRERKNSRRKRLLLNSSEYKDVNPMDSLSNFADVMLVLAVGIMLALVLRWNVPISESAADLSGLNGSQTVSDGSAGTSAGTDTSPSASQTGQETDGSVLPVDGNDLSRVGEIPNSSQKVGNVYYDTQTGKYYIVTE